MSILVPRSEGQVWSLRLPWNRWEVVEVVKGTKGTGREQQTMGLPSRGGKAGEGTRKRHEDILCGQ